MYFMYNVATVNPDSSISWGGLTVTPTVLSGSRDEIDISLGSNQKVYVQGASVIQPSLSWFYEYCDTQFPKCISNCYMDNTYTTTGYLPVYHWDHYPLPPTLEVVCSKI